MQNTINPDDVTKTGGKPITAVFYESARISHQNSTTLADMRMLSAVRFIRLLNPPAGGSSEVFSRTP